MAQITVEEITSKSEWENFIMTRKEANFLQSFNWGEFHKASGNKVHRIGFFENKKIVGMVLCIVEKAKRATYLTIPGGPLINWESKNQINLFRKIIEEIAKKDGCSFIRVRPQILENEKNSKLFESLGFKKAVMHLHAELTHQLDLTKPEEQLLADMRKNTRYEIRQAIKQNIKITVSRNEKDIDDFYALQKETAKRQSFVEFEKDYIQKQFEIFVKDDQVLLYTAYLGKKKLAQALIYFYGEEADYFVGASSLDGRKYPGAYLIQWEVIKEAKKRGIKRYNLWGVAPEGETNHRFWGVSVFKRGFGGEDVEYLHARDLVINPISYKLNQAIELARKKLRRL